MRFDLKFCVAADPAPTGFLEKFDALRTELTDLAFILERRGRVDAADIATAISARLAAWREEWASAQASVPDASRGDGLGRNRSGNLSDT